MNKLTAINRASRKVRKVKQSLEAILYIFRHSGLPGIVQKDSRPAYRQAGALRTLKAPTSGAGMTVVSK